MFLDPDHLDDTAPARILAEAAAGRLGLDHRFLHALLDRPAETVPALVEFGKRDRFADVVDLELDVVSLIRALHAPEGLPFLMEAIRVEPEEIPDEITEAIHAFGTAALDPLLALYHELDETLSEEVAFLLATLQVRDERILRVLLDRLRLDAADGAFLLSIYGDPAALPALEAALPAPGEGDAEPASSIREAINTIQEGLEPVRDDAAFDIYELYPERAGFPLELLSDGERAGVLEHPVAEIRAAAARSFFNREPTPAVAAKLLKMAQSDSDAGVRARAWEALSDAAVKPEVVEAMLTAMRDPATPLEERAGVLVALAPEADRNEVRQAIEEIYTRPEARAKALEAMWRSARPEFRDRFARHLADDDIEVKRNAVWGVGYFAVKSELEKLRALFHDENLRADALFAYALALPGETSRSRVRSLLARVQKDAGGLSEMEEQLVETALDERLLLAGKEPYFAGLRD